MDRDVAGVDVQVAVLRIRRGVRVGEVEPLDCLGDEPVELRRADAPGDRGDLRVDERRSLPRQGRGRVDGGLGDGPGFPRRHPSGLHLRPQPRQAVAQLEGLPDELLRRRRRHPEDPTQLGETELRHQRRTRTRDRLLVLTTRDCEGGRVVDRLRRVQVSPLRRQHELGGGGTLLIDALRSDLGQDGGGGEVLDLTCSGSRQRFDHVFDFTVDTDSGHAVDGWRSPRLHGFRDGTPSLLNQRRRPSSTIPGASPRPAREPGREQQGARPPLVARHPSCKSGDPRFGWVFSHVLAGHSVVLFSRSQTPTVAGSGEVRRTGKKQL